MSSINPCLFCGKLPVRSQPYCSPHCSFSHQAQKRVESWLNTGKLSQKKTPVYVRNYLLTSQNYKCAKCSISNVWQNKTLAFIVDHIDGNSQNNVRSNLRMVCPNCDSQLPTYKSRNRGKGRHAAV